MHHPDFIANLHGIDHAKRIASERASYRSPERRAISNTPDPRPRMGLAISAMAPSAAIVRAARQMDRAPSGNLSNSFSAALIYEMGFVGRVTVSWFLGIYIGIFSDVVRHDNESQPNRAGGPPQAKKRILLLRNRWNFTNRSYLC